MNRQHVYADADHWSWRQETPFAHSVVVGDQVFIGGQQSLDRDGIVVGSEDIAAQTRNVFENMKTCLARVGLDLSDLVRLNTYYVFDGDESEATEFWENMTRVRLEYFPDPGPAATAVRIKGMPYDGQLIQIEGVALRGASRANRVRIMPEGSWDWSIAVPLSQGWKVDERIFVGGQISADETGASVHVGDLDAQTRNIYKFIGTVLSDAGASFKDIVHLKICFKHSSQNASGKAFVDRIMDVTREFVETPGPVVTAFGVDLLYPGLDLEIDAMAIVDGSRAVVTCSGFGGRYQPAAFSDCVSAAGEVYVAGQTALGDDGAVLCPSDVAGQAKIIFERIARVLGETDVSLDDIVKLNLFIVGDGRDVENEFHVVSNVWSQLAPSAHPAMTPVRVHELARPGLLVQADCIALKQPAV